MSIDRILRDYIKKPLPSDEVVPGSVPVAYYGDYAGAKACTVCSNPSHAEFTQRVDPHPVSREAFGIPDDKELDDAACKKVIEYCDDYFTYQPNKDEKWFKGLETISRQFGAYSYEDRSLVHVDVVGWATNRGWRKVSPGVKASLIADARELFKALVDKDFDYLFINGARSVDAAREALQLDLKEYPLSYRNQTGKLYTGAYKKSLIIGWNFFVGDMPGANMIKNTEPHVGEFAKAVYAEYNGRKA